MQFQIVRRVAVDMASASQMELVNATRATVVATVRLLEPPATRLCARSTERTARIVPRTVQEVLPLCHALGAAPVRMGDPELASATVLVGMVVSIALPSVQEVSRPPAAGTGLAVPRVPPARVTRTTGLAPAVWPVLHPTGLCVAVEVDVTQVPKEACDACATLDTPIQTARGSVPVAFGAHAQAEASASATRHASASTRIFGATTPDPLVSRASPDGLAPPATDSA